MSINFDGLFDAALASPTGSNLTKLANALAADENPASQGELLAMLFNQWHDAEDVELSQAQADFIIKAVQLKIGDNAEFRRALGGAVKVLLPPYMSKPGLIRGIGLNDSSVSLHEAVRRFRNLLTINNNSLAFLASLGRWGVIRNVDALAGTVAFAPLGANSTNAVPLTTILNDGTMFQLGVDSQRLAAQSGRAMNSGAEFRSVAKARALTELSDEDIRTIAHRTLVSAIMTEEAFEEWWNKEGGTAAVQTQATVVRGSGSARSLQEMELRLTEEAKSADKVTPELVAAYRNFFENLSQTQIERYEKHLVHVIALMTDRLDADQLAEVIAPLAGRCGFLPAAPESTPLEHLVIFGDLNAKTLAKMFDALQHILAEDYMIKLAGKLPLKALTAIAERMSDEALLKSLQYSTPSADIFLYIWKNRKKRTGSVQDMINIGSVVKALNQNRLPKAWMVAVRELKNTLMDKADFQDHLLRTANHDVKLITGTLQSAHMLGSGERQSLLVKFSRLSQDLHTHLESGAGRKVVEAAGDRVETEKPIEPMFSSVASLSKLSRELDNIINVQQPENREALKAARAHGDFRENAEFDAAKERRNFLTRRRNELERILAQAQAVRFSDVKPGNHAELGCTVTLAYQDGSEEVYHLLGAWDGDPDKRHLSYKTRLGEAIYHHEVGTTLDLPGGKRAVLKKIEALSQEIAQAMDSE